MNAILPSPRASAPSQSPNDFRAERTQAAWPNPASRYFQPERPEPPILPIDDVFSSSCSEAIKAAAEAKAAPLDYIVAALLAVCGSVLGNSRCSYVWDGWTEPPILWTVAIGNPSASKSPALDALLVPLKKAELGIREKAQRSVSKWRDKAELAKLADEAWRAEAKRAIKNGDEPPKRPSAADPGSQPAMPRLAVSDATVERLAVMLASQGRSLLYTRDELAGWLQGMTRYSGGGSDRPFWLEAFGGRSYTVERIGRDPVHVEHLSLGVVGGIQPDRLQALLLNSDDDGLLARFLPFWPNPAPVKRPSLMHDEIFWENVISRLLTLDMRVDDRGYSHPIRVPLTDDAKNLLDGLRHKIREWESESEGLIKSFIGKIAGMTVRLSLVLSYLEWASEPYDKEPHEIGATHFSRAVLFVEAYLLPMARRTYADASVPASERSARRLLALILSEGWHQFTTRQVLRMERAGLNRSYVLEPAINALMEADIIRQITSPPGPKGGRPFRTFAVNPAIHGMHR